MNAFLAGLTVGLGFALFLVTTHPAPAAVLEPRLAVATPERRKVLPFRPRIDA